MNPLQENKLPSGTTETLDETVKRAKALVQPAVSATDLANPPAPAPVTTTPPPTIPDRTGATVSNVLGSIRSQSESAKKLAEEQAAFGTFADQSSGFDIQNQQLERFGVTPEKLKELEDIQLQLAERGTASALTKAQIQGGAGQTLAQSQREVTQETREAAIRDAGLAARASVLQGNIETGRALARDAVDIALQDRTFQANAKLQEIKDLKDVVNEETRQLLEVEERKYTEEQENIERMKDSVDSAITTGTATSAQIAKMTDPNVTDEERLKIAQEVIAQSSSEDRSLKMQQIRASLTASSLSAKKNRLGLCQAGDSSYCKEFNIDPTALTDEEINAKINNQQTSLSLQGDLVRMEGVIKNDVGLQGSAGAVRSPLLASIAVGGGVGYIQKREAKEQFLSDVQYLLNNRVFDKLTELKAKGATFGSLSEGELNTIANASANLSSLAIKDEGGGLIGFRGGEENLREELATYQEIMQRGMDDLNIDALTTSQKNDLMKAWEEN